MKNLFFILIIALLGCGDDDEPMPVSTETPIVVAFSFCQSQEDDPCQFEGGDFSLLDYDFPYSSIGFPYYRNYIDDGGHSYEPRRDILSVEYRYDDPNSVLWDQIFDLQIRTDADAYPADQTLMEHFLATANGEQNKFNIFLRIKYNGEDVEGETNATINKNMSSNQYVEFTDLEFISDTIVQEDEAVMFPVKHIKTQYRATMRARLLLYDQNNPSEGNNLAVDFQYRFLFVFRDEIF